MSDIMSCEELVQTVAEGVAGRLRGLAAMLKSGSIDDADAEWVAALLEKDAEALSPRVLTPAQERAVLLMSPPALYPMSALRPRGIEFERDLRPLIRMGYVADGGYPRLTEAGIALRDTAGTQVQAWDVQRLTPPLQVNIDG